MKNLFLSTKLQQMRLSYSDKLFKYFSHFPSRIDSKELVLMFVLMLRKYLAR